MTGTMPVPLKSRKAAESFRAALLSWYDTHGRTLPWRVKNAGQLADPYHVWLSEVMLQQTTVPAVIPYFGKFVDKWPSVHDLAAAPDDAVMAAWAGLGYYARARNLLKCARVVSAELNGCFPSGVEDLKKLPGIGDYTAAAIAAIAFDRVATVIDGNVDRVVARYCAIETPLPAGKADIRTHATALYEGGKVTRPGDFAQAMMDLGALICTPKTPKCALCPVAATCAGRLRGVAADLPRKAPKKVRPKRYGYVYWIERADGAVLLEKRPGRGLLGGMTGFPTSDWVDHISAIKLRDNATMMDGVAVRHVFTHFELTLYGVRLSESDGKIEDGRFWSWPDAVVEAMPSLFRKFYRLVAVAHGKD